MEYDYVIAGGGSSACVAAMRLVRDHGARVLLIERGPARYARLMRMPAGYMKYLWREDFLEMHHTAPQPQLGGRGPIVPQARVVGGGSSVNAIVYMRGQREDYDDWDAYLGKGSGWSYADLLPHFKALEKNANFNDEYHGIDGRLLVSDPGQLCDTTRRYILAAQGAGIPYNRDFNGARQAGVGVMQHTMGIGPNGKMQRCDAVTAFLSQVMADERLTVVTESQVTRILFDGRRAVGVEYLRNGATFQAHAAREVLVAAGTYNTPKLLMLSGLGPADHLREHGIAVHTDLPGIGQNLQDHHEVPVIALTREPGGYHGQDHGWRMIRNGLQYLLFGTGPVTARLMMVGEQPGDQEDRQGEPFVGPAGRLLDDALAAAGVARDAAYVTNAVKHFNFRHQGARRIHETPKAGHIGACRPWLDAELALALRRLRALLDQAPPRSAPVI